MLTPRPRSSCGDSNPLRDVFTIQRGAAAATATKPEGAEREEKLDYWEKGEVTVMYDKEAGTQIIQHQDSVTDYCSLSSEPPGSDSSSITGLGSPVSRSSASLSADQLVAGGNPDQTVSDHQAHQDSAGADGLPCSELQAFTVLSVNRTLWVPRYRAQRAAKPPTF